MSKPITLLGIPLFFATMIGNSAMAIDTAPVADIWEKSAITTSQMRISEEAGRREVHIPIHLLQGKSSAAVHDSIENALNLLRNNNKDSNNKGKNPSWAGSATALKASQDTQMALATLASGKLTSNCPDLTIGLISSASAAREYSDGTRGIIFWPTFQPIYGSLPQDTYTGSWEGATSALFYGKTRSNYNNETNKISAEVFQYTLPAMDCKSVVAWYAEAEAEATQPWTTSGGVATIDSDWMHASNGSGTGFPFILSYDIIKDGLYQFGFYNRTYIQIKQNATDFESDFYASANVKPSIYLGFMLKLKAYNGLASTFQDLRHGLGDTFSFPDGILYLRAPVQ